MAAFEIFNASYALGSVFACMCVERLMCFYGNIYAGGSVARRQCFVRVNIVDSLLYCTVPARRSVCGIIRQRLRDEHLQWYNVQMQAVT